MPAERCRSTAGIVVTVAITHFTPQIIGRADGRSAVLSAAYRHCAKMEHDAEARTVDYSAKRNLAHEEFLLPVDAPQWARVMIADRSVAGAAEAFWNKIEAFEKRADAQFAKEFIIALPVELSKAQNIALVRQFVHEQVLGRGQVADWVYHDDPGNPHIHLMTTLRPLTETGFGGKKVAMIGADGQAVRTKTGKIQYRLWAGEKAEFLEQRQRWLDLQNQHLALGGFEIRVDGRSYAERGIDLVPTTHIGPGAKAIERKTMREGRASELERLASHATARAVNAARIKARPEIVLDLVSREKSVFDERDIAKVLHRYVDDPGAFQQLLARILQSPDCLRLEAGTVDFATGERLPDKFTTRELIRLEAEMVSRASALVKAKGFGVREKIVADVFARHDRLSVEQRTAIEHVTSGARIATVVGRAGAGKTTMMRAAREAWEAAGYTVVGGALAGKAAEGLETEAGIPSRTLASWGLRWNEARNRLDRKTIFVMDEAGMVASKQMAAFVEAVSRAGAKLVLVGDAEQLQPIEAGAAFRAIVERTGYAELEKIYRQKDAWMRTASLDLARGNVKAALSAYRGHGMVIGEKLKARAVESLIASWNREYDPEKSTLILAHLRRDVRALNILAREKLVERGIVGEGHAFQTEEGPRHFDAGDHIVFLRNEGALGVKNGMIGRVVEAGPGRIVAEVGEGEGKRRVEVEERFYRNLDLGYATTIHKSQGATVDRVKVLASLSLDRHLTYVAMTRHREDLQLFYGERSFQIAGGLDTLLSQRNAKETTLDYAAGRFYREALSFANSRGLHLMRIARTLARDRLEWTLRQKRRLADLGRKLRAVGARIGLFDTILSAAQSKKETEPMVKGVTTFSQSISDVAAEKVHADKEVARQWEEVSDRFRLVFADPEAAFCAMRFDAMLSDPATASERLGKLVREPTSMGALRGREGILASRAERQARREAEANVPALGREIERYLRLREEATRRLEADEMALRRRVSIDIPALSRAARAVLEKVRDAIDRNDLSAALGFALADRMAKAEIDGFNKAVSERFGERTLLSNGARDTDGAVFRKASLGLPAAEREQLAAAWPMMRAGQQLAAHERTVKALKETEALRQSQRQSQVLK